MMHMHTQNVMSRLRYRNLRTQIGADRQTTHLVRQRPSLPDNSWHD